MSPTFIDAVKSVAPTLASAHRQILEALLYAPDHSASAGQLRTLLGLAAVVQVNSAIGLAGRKIKEAFGAHPDGLAVGDYEWWHVIATGQAEKGRAFVWTLREEVVAGLISCGFSVSGTSMPEEITGEETLTEGAKRQVTVNAYERNPVARARCIEAHGTMCSVCEFDFGETYGSAAAGFIHVHHTKPLASVGVQYEVDPVEDLRPVCPNCHAVIHIGGQTRSIEEVKAMLSSFIKTPNKLLQPTAPKDGAPAEQ
jgi:predicted HNH restriction endonuclease